MKIFIVNQSNPHIYFLILEDAYNWAIKNCDYTHEDEEGRWIEFSITEWEQGEDYSNSKTHVYFIKESD